MSDTTNFTIGSDVACTDGDCGELARVVVDPVARTLTHLVVEPPHQPGAGRLVPIALVDPAASGEVRLRCTKSEFEALEHAEETEFLPGARGDWGYTQQQMWSQPYYGLGMGGLGVGGMAGFGIGGMGMGATRPASQVIVTERVPVGEVEVRRGQPVHAADGEIGRVHGLIIEPTDHHVTHVLLQEGHLWGKKEVAIPISAVADVDHGVQVNLTKDEIHDLPSVELDPVQ